MHDLPYDDGHFGFVWCRDVLEQVDDLDGALAELVRVTQRGRHLLVYTTVATDLLDGRDAEMMRRHIGNVDGNLDAASIEEAFRRAGLVIERKDIIGTESARTRRGAHAARVPGVVAPLPAPASTRSIITAHGDDIYDHIEANLHWEVFQFLGKLQPVVYLLRRP